MLIGSFSGSCGSGTGVSTDGFSQDAKIAAEAAMILKILFMTI
jgi:hypothetical protein